MTTDREAGEPYGIKGFPTIKFFGFDKSKPIDYSGARDDSAIVSYALDKVQSEVNKRKSGGGSSSKPDRKQKKNAGGSE
jgi:protein disulfide-isomerase A6